VLTPTATGFTQLIWHLPTDTFVTFADTALMFRPNNPGTYPVQLVAEASSGCSDTAALLLTFLPPVPNVHNIAVRIVDLNLTATGALTYNLEVRNLGNQPEDSLWLAVQAHETTASVWLTGQNLQPGQVRILQSPVGLSLNPYLPNQAFCAQLALPASRPETDLTDNRTCAPLTSGEIILAAVYPSPMGTNPQLNLRLVGNLASPTPAKLTVLDALGRSVLELQPTLQSNTQEVILPLNLSALSAGFYTLQLQLPNQTLTRSFVR
jgi:hypothetical protein